MNKVPIAQIDANMCDLIHRSVGAIEEDQIARLQCIFVDGNTVTVLLLGCPVDGDADQSIAILCEAGAVKAIGRGPPVHIAGPHL